MKVIFSDPRRYSSIIMTPVTGDLSDPSRDTQPAFLPSLILGTCRRTDDSEKGGALYTTAVALSGIPLAIANTVGPITGARIDLARNHPTT